MLTAGYKGLLKVVKIKSMLLLLKKKNDTLADYQIHVHVHVLANDQQTAPGAVQFLEMVSFSCFCVISEIKLFFVW